MQQGRLPQTGRACMTEACMADKEDLHRLKSVGTYRG